MPNKSPAMTVDQSNYIARNMVIEKSLNVWQQISSQTFAATDLQGQVYNFPVKQVGLLKRFLIKAEATVARSAAETQTRTLLGGANLFSNVTVTDLNNQNRINTTGWHLNNLATARRQNVFGAAYTTDNPTGTKANFAPLTSPSSFTASNQTIRQYYELPICYSDFDLRGAIWAGVVNATMNNQITVNQQFFVASTADGLLAGYKSSTTDLGKISSLTVTIYQNYLDQLPQTNKGPVLPLLDMAHSYELHNTNVTGLVANQDAPFSYPNFRQFLSTFAIYDNFGYSTSIGGDINFWALQAANSAYIWKLDPMTAALLTRQIIGDDFNAEAGAACFYFDHRQKPIETIQYGNMQLVLNPSNVQGASTQVLIGAEGFALTNQVVDASSFNIG